MESEMNPAMAHPDVEIISVSTVYPTASLSRFITSGRENEEPFGSLFDVNEALNIGFIDDQMFMDVLWDNNVVDKSPFQKFVLPQTVQVDTSCVEKIENDEVEVIFEDVKRPCSSPHKAKANQAKELLTLTIENQMLTKDNEALLKELQDLKVEVAQQKAKQLLARREHCNQVLDVLNTDLTCSICSDVIIEAVAIECGHIFCSHCISTWFVQQTISPSCPTCRAVTFKDPIKISKLSSAIASFHTLLSEDDQSDRRQALHDRKAEEKQAQEAAASRDEWFRNLSQAHERVSESVRHLRGLSPEVNAFGEDSPAQDQAPYLQQQVALDPPASFVSAPPVGYNLDHLNFPFAFREDRLSFAPSLSQHQSPDALPTQNPTRPTTLPMPSLSSDHQGQATFVPPTPTVLSRHHQAPEVSISDDGVVEMAGRLQQGSPSISHQFYIRDSRLRRRPY